MLAIKNMIKALGWLLATPPSSSEPDLVIDALVTAGVWTRRPSKGALNSDFSMTLMWFHVLEH